MDSKILSAVGEREPSDGDLLPPSGRGAAFSMTARVRQVAGWRRWLTVRSIMVSAFGLVGQAVRRVREVGGLWY